MAARPNDMPCGAVTLRPPPRPVPAPAPAQLAAPQPVDSPGPAPSTGIVPTLTTYALPSLTEESCSGDDADGNNVDSFDTQQDRRRPLKTGPVARPRWT